MSCPTDSLSRGKTLEEEEEEERYSFLRNFTVLAPVMSVFHDEVEIEDFEYDEEEQIYYYPCPCGDRFQISKEELLNGEEIATCPSCSLIIKVIYDLEAFEKDEEEVKGLTDDLKKLEVAK